MLMSAHKPFVTISLDSCELTHRLCYFVMSSQHLMKHKVVFVVLVWVRDSPLGASQQSLCAFPTASVSFSSASVSFPTTDDLCEHDRTAWLLHGRYCELIYVSLGANIDILVQRHKDLRPSSRTLQIAWMVTSQPWSSAVLSCSDATRTRTCAGCWKRPTKSHRFFRIPRICFLLTRYLGT